VKCTGEEKEKVYSSLYNTQIGSEWELEKEVGKGQIQVQRYRVYTDKEYRGQGIKFMSKTGAEGTRVSDSTKNGRRGTGDAFLGSQNRAVT